NLNQPTTSATGSEVWKTDGTVAGTKLALEMRAGTTSSSPTYLTVFGDKLVFRASGVDPVTNATVGTELFVSDGTQAGTTLIDVRVGTSSSSPANARTAFPTNNAYSFAVAGPY